MSGITLDVTERVNRAAEVDQLQGDLIAAIENFSDTFVAVDEHWRVTYINHRAATTVGRTCQEAIGADLWSLSRRMSGRTWRRRTAG
jgi:PAS domain-containing protein